MAARLELLTALKPLIAAYPGQHIDKAALKLYLDQLKDIPAWLLKLAVNRHIRSSPWFPKISELRETAAQIAGTSNFSGLHTPPLDYLHQEQLRLEAAFHDHNFLDPKQWERLAARYEQADRPHSAQAVREKLHGRVNLLVSQLGRNVKTLEDAFYAGGRLDPDEWERQAVQFDPLGRPHHAFHAREKICFLLTIQGKQALAAPHPLDSTEAEAHKLKAAAQALEDAFFAGGRLDPAEWENLALEFERLDRPHRAANTREKLRRLQTDSETQPQAS